MVFDSITPVYNNCPLFFPLLEGSAPLTAVQLLWVNMIMDTLGALALATEPPNDEMMKRPPVRRGDNFITRIMWRNILGQGLYQLLVLATLMVIGKKLLSIEGPQSDKTINTLIFNSFVFCQVCELQVPFTCK
jgi:Ca2+-transporting ATPase